ncbi:MAG: hypothetical protein FJ108_01790 [Deltaproteobacteria bacterium]|nr:hypothetical protein [Deltaproteobacteria bacterium]
MKRILATAITLLCVACGDDSDHASTSGAVTGRAAPARGAENSPPEIISAEIEPEGAWASEPMSLAIVASDPDRDRVKLEIEWYRNSERVADLDGADVPAGSFARGDRVYAIVYASDGRSEVTHQTGAIIVANSPPSIRRVAITPMRATALDLLQAEVDARDEDGDPVELSYRWLRNGQPIGDSEGPRLEPGAGHRGEVVVLQVRGSDGTAESDWIASAPLTIGNAPPEITTQPNYTLSGSSRYDYEVAARDPDGDRPLKYELVEGPPGMAVDIVSGRVSWQVPGSAKGVYPIELRVSDPYGGKTTQSYSLAVDWSELPASAAAPATPSRATAAPPVEERDGDYTEEDRVGEDAGDEF